MLDSHGPRLRAAAPSMALAAAIAVGGCSSFDDDGDTREGHALASRAESDGGPDLPAQETLQAERSSAAPAEVSDSTERSSAEGSGGETDPAETAGSSETGGTTSETEETVCGRDPIGSPTEISTAPCRHGDLVVDRKIERSRGSAETVEQTFDIDEEGELCITIRPLGSSPGPEPAAARVEIDGSAVAEPDDFRGNAEGVQRTIDIEAGPHDLSLRVASKPGSRFAVELRAVGGGTGGPVTEGDNGILELHNVAVDHPMFSPNGDGFHETATFNADNRHGRLPGGDSSEYHVDWEWRLVDSDSCEETTILEGETPLNSPTNVRATWDGGAEDGGAVESGGYLYEYRARLVRSESRIVDRAVSRARGMLVERESPDYSGSTLAGECDPGSDPYDCRCPDETDEKRRCTFAWIPYLPTFGDPPSSPASNFIAADQAPETGRWRVVVDLREATGGGLVRQSGGEWRSVDQLQQYIASLTGVPPDPQDRQLFNFDYTQFGYSTPVTVDSGPVEGFNHFLLDLITDRNGRLTIAGDTIDVAAQLEGTGGDTPSDFQIDETREGDECVHNGNFDGTTAVEAKTCNRIYSVNLAPGDSEIGIHVVASELFDFQVDGLGTERDTHCIVNGIYKCGVRTFHRDTDAMTVGGGLYADRDALRRIRGESETSTDVPALVVHTDRRVSTPEASVFDGFCARNSATYGDLGIPLDAATGAVPSTCIVNGIY